MKERFFCLVIAVITIMFFAACEKIENHEKILVGKWVTSSYHAHAGNCDTIIFMENLCVQEYFCIFANQIIPALYSGPYVTYSLLGNKITFTVHFSYPSEQNFDETFEYVLSGNSLIIKGFSNPFSDTKEVRSDVHFTRINSNCNCP